MDIIERELTARQRHALTGRIFDEKPLAVLADELGTNVDNVYKLLHDARKRLKRALVARGIIATPDAPTAIPVATQGITNSLRWAPEEG
jgi:RNA polymerase sigma-70 factor (ECF subfamily)